MKMQITFKSGAQIEVDATEFTVGRSRITNQLASLRWTTPENWTSKLSYLGDLEDVAAIVSIDDGMESFRPAEGGGVSVPDPGPVGGGMGG